MSSPRWSVFSRYPAYKFDRDCARPLLPFQKDPGAKRGEERRQIHVRVGMRQRTTHGGDVANAHVGESLQRACDHWPPFPHLGRALERTAGRQRAHAKASIRVDTIEANFAQVNQARWPQHAGFHHEHQRCSAGKRPRPVVVEERQASPRAAGCSNSKGIRAGARYRDGMATCRAIL
jgi:hypothetical protein